MKKLILGTIIGGIVGAVLILTIIALFDSNKKKNQAGLQLVANDSTKSNEPKKHPSLVYGDYMNLDSTDFLLIPFGLKTNEEAESKILKNRSTDDYASDPNNNSSYRTFKYNFYSLNFGNCNNIIFYNKKTDSTYLLLQKPSVISQFYFPYYNKEYPGKKYWFMLFAVHEDDTNKDGFINSDDAEKVYISNLKGTKLTQIAPDSTQLIDWYIDESTNNILMKIKLDSNHDKKYNFDDDIEIIKTSITSPDTGKAIISQSIKENIKTIMKQIK